MIFTNIDILISNFLSMPEMRSKKLAGNKPSESTQKYLDIAEIKRDTIALKDGSLRAVVAVSSTNFALKSEDEQGAISASYQSFLNSLEFPIQILIQSRVLDINGYLEKLKILESGQTNELLRVQMNEYVEFVGKLVEFANIMKKSFFVAVPYYSGGGSQNPGLFAKLKGLINPVANISTETLSFEKAGVKLEERVMQVVSGLSSVGLRSIRLNTEELVELVYQSYNFEGVTPIFEGALTGVEIDESGSDLQAEPELSK